MKKTREDISNLIAKIATGDNESFRELGIVAKPLLTSLALKFSNFHPKFEFDDFYSIALTALYKACLSYNFENPSFLDYAKVIIIRECYREVGYWNAEMRNIFNTQEVTLDNVDKIYMDDDLINEFILEEFRANIKLIIDDCFDQKKGMILRLYLLHDYKVSEISKLLDLKYKNVYSTVTRGTERIINEYNKRFLDSTLYL